jgi:branched-chain amino acid transport system ATP-binding protein
MLLGATAPARPRPLRTIMGLWRASRGEIRLGQKRIEALATPDIARAGIGYVPETMAVFSDLTVRENLVLAAREGAMDQARLDWIFGFFPPLKKFWLSRPARCRADRSRCCPSRAPSSRSASCC